MKKKDTAVPSNPDKEWEHQNNHDTVMKAMEVMMDTDKMKHVHRIMKKKKKAMKSIQDLKDKYASMSADEDKDGD